MVDVFELAVEVINKIQNKQLRRLVGGVGFLFAVLVIWVLAIRVGLGLGWLFSHYFFLTIMGVLGLAFMLFAYLIGCCFL
jgi:hypothetical protein